MKSKHLFLVIISLVVASLLVVGCGAQDEVKQATKSEPKVENEQVQQEEETQETEAETEEEAEVVAETRIVSHYMGETEIPSEPKRIVTTQYLGELLALGVKPVGAPEYHLDDTFLKAHTQGIENIGSQIDLEAVLSLDPDLIIGSNFDEKIYEELSKIAPTVLISWMDYDVRGHLEVVADVVGKQEEAKKWLEEFDQKSSEGEAKVKAKISDETVAIYRISQWGFQAYGPRNIGYVFYNALNINAPELIEQEMANNPKYHSTEISLEVLNDYAADHIFLAVDGDEQAKKAFKEISESSIWSNLPAVKNGNLYFIDKDTWLPYDPMSIAGQLDEAVKLFTE